MTADRPASSPLPTQTKLSLKGTMKATGMEGMQAEILPIPSFNRLLKIPTIRMTVSQTGTPQSLQNRLQQMAVERIPMILKKHHRSAEKISLRNHKPSEPSWVGKDDSIDKEEFPSKQTNGDAEEALEPDAGSDEPTIPESKNRKDSVQSAMTVPQEGADSQNSAFSEFFDETTDRISGTRF